MYKSRVEELNEQYGAYSAQAAELDHNLHILNLKTDNMMELTYPERKRVHNLKYYTWVEQQGMTSRTPGTPSMHRPRNSTNSSTHSTTRLVC